MIFAVLLIGAGAGVWWLQEARERAAEAERAAAAQTEREAAAIRQRLEAERQAEEERRLAELQAQEQRRLVEEMFARERKQAEEKAVQERRQAETEPARPAWQQAILAAKSGKASQPVRDCPDCPEMVVVPAGTFLMGSPATEAGRSNDEGPQHKVTFSRPFALGRYEVTFAEWDACVAAGGCNGGRLSVQVWGRGSDQGWGRGRRPVINVSWRDTQAYVAWLSRATGKRYRLPSEAEWEYAARAGTTTPFSFGATITTDQANYNGNYTYGTGRKGEYRGRTVPVGSLPVNPWGLYEMHGNVWEWVEDVWHDSYQGAPADGSVWTDLAGPDYFIPRVLRGGFWGDVPWFLRSARRRGSEPVYSGDSSGFRVARTLE